MSVRDVVSGDPLLVAGFDAFARHGFKRATMADIAAAAGMSRPALYLRVKNKEDVMRAVGAALLADSITRARAAADDETGDIATRVVAVLEAKLGLTLGLAERSEHALELLAEYGRVATSEAAQYTAEVERLTARVLAATDAGADRCAVIATALVRTVQGLETELDDAQRARKLLTALVDTTVAGLTRS
ncbi:TetR/AcrR family transcriptional regulator [Lentzea sp. NEAU-D7]|uniref:TetR/AcrR family transcriptional regulator n=1 Tax=Lentzea sp. NEAU-D7 TaxID=2994667 RepID=UPI00224B2FAF|nr:TetR family transcriptional regulator [Lentzea sp. NEAU-D7]MCX2947893.1 TetR family transcriptional regulator [Lentzea sp. NEAU-D7]